MSGPVIKWSRRSLVDHDPQGSPHSSGKELLFRGQDERLWAQSQAKSKWGRDTPSEWVPWSATRRWEPACCPTTLQASGEHIALCCPLDEGWGGMVEVGPSAPWSAPRKWEPRPCRAQRAGYRALLHSVSLCYVESIEIISTISQWSVPRLFNWVITKKRKAQRMASPKGPGRARKGRRHGV